MAMYCGFQQHTLYQICIMCYHGHVPIHEMGRFADFLWLRPQEMKFVSFNMHATTESFYDERRGAESTGQNRTEFRPTEEQKAMKRRRVSILRPDRMLKFNVSSKPLPSTQL